MLASFVFSPSVKLLVPDGGGVIPLPPAFASTPSIVTVNDPSAFWVILSSLILSLPNCLINSCLNSSGVTFPVPFANAP